MTYEIPQVTTPPVRGSAQRLQRTISTNETLNNSSNNIPGNSNTTGPRYSTKVTPGLRASPLPHYNQSASPTSNNSTMDGKSQVPGQQVQRLPVQYIRIYFGKTTIKTARNSLASLRTRLCQCFKMNNSFRLHYLDQDETTPIVVFDEKCFNIFLQSNVKKNLYMEKTKD